MGSFIETEGQRTTFETMWTYMVNQTAGIVLSPKWELTRLVTRLIFIFAHCRQFSAHFGGLHPIKLWQMYCNLYTLQIHNSKSMEIKRQCKGFLQVLIRIVCFIIFSTGIVGIDLLMTHSNLDDHWFFVRVINPRLARFTQSIHN